MTFSEGLLSSLGLAGLAMLITAVAGLCIVAALAVYWFYKDE